jgi:hypothetical protein
MSNGWMSKLQQKKQQESSKNRLVDKNFADLTPEDIEPTFHNRDMGILGCKHYQRATKLQAHCCGRWFACRFCHDEISDHTIVRYAMRMTSPRTVLTV